MLLGPRIKGSERVTEAREAGERDLLVPPDEHRKDEGERRLVSRHRAARCLALAHPREAKNLGTMRPQEQRRPRVGSWPQRIVSIDHTRAPRSVEERVKREHAYQPEGAEGAVE